MATDAHLEQRLATVERELAELKQQLRERGVQGQNSKKAWLEKFDGAFKDEPAFDEVIEYGRQIRQADRLE